MDLSFFIDYNILDAGNLFFREILNINLAPAAKSGLDIKEFLKDFLADEMLLGKVEDARLIGMINDHSLQDKDQEKSADDILKKDDGDYDMLLVFGIELADGVQPTKSDISRLTRALNRRSASRPVVLLTRYSDKLSFSAAERGQYKREGQKGEKIGRISILKDINLIAVHAGHERMLTKLKLSKTITSFTELYNSWRNVFDLKILNTEFYAKVAEWYSRAIAEVKFPDEYYLALPENKDKKRNEVQEIANQIACIRLLTRIIFVWFLKHKHRGQETLIPDKIFSKKYIDTILNYSDKHKSTYYKAVLQNLFFATFNTNIDSPQRSFSRKNFSDHQMPRFRYESFFINPAKSVNELFSNIPFLNGGLFENLDMDHKTRIDWFSDPDLTKPGTSENKLVVPDNLFFGDSENEGLFDIFNKFYFTIEENTPLDQEIALDPELLGKIFENLLAAYLPESKSSARRKTGSYYTPREIVNYMVDESLITYLLIRLHEAGETDKNKNEDKLRILFAYNSDSNPFGDNEKISDLIIKYLSEIKILDPACGSGAFPMGMLHQIVYALGKLDPGNEKWEKEQLEILLKPKIDDLITVSHISSEKAKLEAEKQLQKEMNEIRETFLKNDPDYTRKLYLIQNCIFGVDIQPVAIHISKLRFFISLIVNQDIDGTARKENYGIKPLPNLETKFVAANTLKELLAPTTRTGDVIDIEKKLKELRKSFFFTKNRSEKNNLEKEDARLRGLLEKKLEELYSTDNRQFESQIENLQQKKELLEKELRKPTLKDNQKSAIKKELKQITVKVNRFGEKMINEGQVTTLAHQIARWNPYNQNTYANWFDPEWMFGLPANSGFDIVIGNPPYGGTKLEEEITNSLGLESKDPYGAFIARFLGSGARITPLKHNGILSYIVSDTFMTIKSHLPLRKQMMDNYIHNMIRVHQDTFGATVNTAVIICRRNEFPKDENGQTVRVFDKRHHCQMADLTNVSIHDHYQRFIEILQQTVSGQGKGQISTPEYAIYTYPQKLIISNSNLPFFAASPKLFSLMNDGNDPDNRPEMIIKEIGGKNVNVRIIRLNDKKIELVKLGDIAEVRQGLATGDNPSYLFQRPEARGNYRSIEDYIDFLLTEDDLDLIRKNEKLRLEVIERGISKDDPKSKRYFGGKYIVPYDKGGESDADEGWMPNYYVPTNYFIDWSEWAVERMNTYTIAQRIIDKNENKSIKEHYNSTLCAVFRSPEKYFCPAISFSRTGVYSPTFRIGSRTPFDTEGSMIFQSFYEIPTLLSLLSSKMTKYSLKNFIGHTVHSQVDELKELIIPLTLNNKIRQEGESIIAKQKSNFEYDYSSFEQISIDHLTFKDYGLYNTEMEEIENWYSRRYPRLSSAQKANLRKLGKSDDYLELYGLRNKTL